MRKRRIRNAGLLLAALLGYFWFVKSTGMGIPCPFQYFFHLKCPGCGITRMFLAISEGEFREAFRWNPAVFLGLPFLLWLLLRQLWAYLREKPVQMKGWEQRGLVFYLILLLIFGVIRNFSGASFL